MMRVPLFAVIGQPNEGKTTVMATLAEDDRAEISPVPGTTLRAERYPVKIDGEEIILFFDTPGFERPAETLEWLRQHADVERLPAAFLAAHQHDPRFSAECEILKPLSEGAAAIYVVDASRPVREVDRQEIEILRLCGNPRIGVINSKSAEETYLDDWQRLLSRDFNHRHIFNACMARYRDRIRLLESIKAVIQEWEPAMDRAITALKLQWDDRITQSARKIGLLIRDILETREYATIQHPGDEARARRDAEDKLRNRVRLLEEHFRRDIRKLYRHTSERWEAEGLVAEDLFDSEEVWRMFGLSRRQLAVAGAGVGATAGLGVDAATGGLTHGAAAAAGAILGAAGAWFGSEHAVKLELPHVRVGPLRFGGKVGGGQIASRIDPRSNLIWIVLDRALLYVEAASNWSHGRREEELLPMPETRTGYTSSWDASNKRIVTDYARQVLRKNSSPAAAEKAERQLLSLLRRTLEEAGSK
jgi:hypothetical protein